MSLDGVVQRPELWTFDYRSDDVAQAATEQLLAADALLMGRNTYDIFPGHWPSATRGGAHGAESRTIPGLGAAGYIVPGTPPGVTRLACPELMIETEATAMKEPSWL